jgi:hypothetical protein
VAFPGGRMEDGDEDGLYTGEPHIAPKYIQTYPPQQCAKPGKKSASTLPNGHLPA